MTYDPQPAAAALLEARRTREWLDSLPNPPADDAEAYAVQDLVAAALGPVAAWKVGAGSPSAAPGRAPIHAAQLSTAPRLPASLFHVIGIEAEIAYRMGRDLPPRAAPYTEAEVLDAVAALHPVIEVVDTRFAALNVAPAPSHRADQQNHGALAVGPGLADWRGVVQSTQPVELDLNGVVAHRGRGGNPAGEPARLLLWLANGGAASLGGLRAGQYVTTGSCTGLIMAEPGTRVIAEFPGLGHCEVSID